MAKQEHQNEEAIRRLLSRATPEKPSLDFTSRLMERIEAIPEPVSSWVIRYQRFILLSALVLTILLLFFPVWSWFGLEFTPGRFILFYAAEGFRIAAVWLGEALSALGTLGKISYLFPVSVAILLLVALDQSLRRPSHRTSKA